jgi:hypothetical protein
MIARLFEMPLFDAIIIGLMIWALFFRKTNKKPPAENRDSKKTTIHQNNHAQNPQHKSDEGKYIDYEEIK